MQWYLCGFTINEYGMLRGLSNGYAVELTVFKTKWLRSDNSHDYSEYYSLKIQMVMY